MNGSSLHNETKQYGVQFPVAEKIGFSVAYLAILLVAVTGNSFVIHMARKLLSAGRGPFNILVINMAASDILYALTIVPLEVKHQYVGLLWFPGWFGTFLCKFLGFAIMFAITSSILTLIAMTVDRYLAIVPVVKKPLTRRNVLTVIVIIMAISFAYSSTALFKMNTVSHIYSETKLTFCRAAYSGDNDLAEKLHKAELTSLFILLFVIPVVVMSVLYFFIIRFLWLRKVPGNRTDQNEKKRRKHLRKVTCVLFTMAATFAVTWFPVHVAHYYFAYDIEWRIHTSLITFFFWSAHTNCATNPCFYLIFNKEYRDEMRRILQRGRCTNSQQENRVQECALQQPR